MDRQLSHSIMAAISARTKRAYLIRNPDTQAFIDAANTAANANVRGEAVGDLGRIGLAMLGLGAAARGTTGLLGVARQNLGKKLSTRSGPSMLTLPYPVEPDDDPERQKKPRPAKAAADNSSPLDLLRLPAATAVGGGALGGLYGVATGKPVLRHAARGTLLGGGAGLGLMAGGAVGGLGGGGLGAGLAYLAGRNPLAGGALGSLLGAIGGGVYGTGKGYQAVRHVLDDEDDDKEKRGAVKEALEVTYKTAIPWYRPAMALTGLGGLALGWKGVDAVLDSRRKAQREQELDDARQEFHEALLSQYSKPLATAGKPLDGKTSDGKKSAADATSSDEKSYDDSEHPEECCPHCGARLERGDDGNCNRCGKPWPEKGVEKAALFETLSRVYDGLEKVAGLLKSGSRLGDLGGEALGMYGTYAALSGLATGALVYEQAQKRQRRAVLDKAMKRRERRRFFTAPPEIVAMPEPIAHLPKVDFKNDMKMIAAPSAGLDPDATEKLASFFV